MHMEYLTASLACIITAVAIGHCGKSPEVTVLEQYPPCETGKAIVCSAKGKTLCVDPITAISLLEHSGAEPGACND